VPPERVAARGPGRVNLIGEHTDYNDGLCLPFAIERGVTVTAEATAGAEIEARALDLGEDDRFPLEGDLRGCDGWRAFARGTVAELRAAGYPLRPARLLIEGDLVPGVGLSSSAALETALALALLALAGVEEPDRMELAKLCSRVENDWVGAETGLLDQLAALFGQEGHALRIDIRALVVVPVPLDLGEWRLATLHSGTEHSHAASGYNERRAECRTACAELGLASLREATLADVERLPSPLDRRVGHVVTENERVGRTVSALGRRDLDEVGRLLDASHASLRDDYDASVPDVERTIARLKSAGAAGARMVGGGFGGSVLALFPPDAAPPDGCLLVAPGSPARLL
jgi:galactokinase